MATDTNLRAFLLNIPELTDIIGAQCFQDKVPQYDERTKDHRQPWVWFSLGGHEYEQTCDDPVGEEPFQLLYDVECVSDDLGESKEIAGIIRTNLNNYSGTFGEGEVQVALVEDQDDLYVPRNMAADEGLSITALLVRIIPFYGEA